MIIFSLQTRLAMLVWNIEHRTQFWYREVSKTLWYRLSSGIVRYQRHYGIDSAVHWSICICISTRVDSNKNVTISKLL